VRLAREVVMQYDGDFVNVILRYLAIHDKEIAYSR
jgi:hypothetical protein